MVLQTRVDYARYLNEFDAFTGQATLQDAPRANASGADAEFFGKVTELAKHVVANHELFLLFVGG